MIGAASLRKLYVQEKKSSAQIAEILKCSAHKVNYWIKKHQIPKRPISDAVYQRYNPNGDPFKIKEIRTLDEAKLLGIGLGLFWGEGNKRNKNSVRLGNTDPALISKYLEFLTNILGVTKEKMRFGLQVFSDMSAEKSLKFWLKSLKKFDIKRDQFFKVTVTPARSIGNYREKSKFGVLTVYVSNTKLKKVLDAMLPL